MSQQKLPLVSVVTPAYNQANFLRDTIESVLSQDYPNIEYLVLNDGSTDNTEDILHEYTGRIRWETHSNMGQTATINKGWSKSTGSIITWLNSDDTLLPGTISWIVNYFNTNHDVDIVYGDTLFTDVNGNPLKKSRPMKIFENGFDYRKFVIYCENPIPQPSAFIRRQVLDNTGYLDQYYYYFMDWEYWLRAGLKNQIKYESKLLSTYRLHPESKTVSQSLKYVSELEKMYISYFNRKDISHELLNSRSFALANMYFTTGGYYAKGGNILAKKRSAKKALKTYPFGIFKPSFFHKYIYGIWGESFIYSKLKKMIQFIR